MSQKQSKKSAPPTSSSDETDEKYLRALEFAIREDLSGFVARFAIRKALSEVENNNCDFERAGNPPHPTMVREVRQLCKNAGISFLGKPGLRTARAIAFHCEQRLIRSTGEEAFAKFMRQLARLQKSN